MADQQVVEYCFSAEPAWACDAIECTKTGVEFNFEKLCLHCKSGQLPEKITIYLEAATASTGGGSVPTSKANEMKGVKVNGTSDGAPAGSGSGGLSASAAPANETFLEKEIRIAKDRDEMLRQEKLQRDSMAGIRQPTAEGRRDSQDSGSAASRPSSASRAAAGATPTLRAAAVASASPPSGGSGGALVTASVTASPKLFKSNEFTRSPNYKYEDPVQQDVRIALLREEEMRQQRAAGASSKQQPAAAVPVAAVTAPEPRVEARVDPPAASKPAVSAANGTAPDKGSSPSLGRDIVIVESPSSSAVAKETKGQLFGLAVAPATPAVSKIEAEIREQMAREAEYKRSTAN